MDSKQVRGMMEAYASIYEKKGDCVDKKDKGMHNCAKKVCHEQYGEGECIFGQHAVPDENGFVSHYDVQFVHGIVENVSVEELEIITEGSHNEENHQYEGEMIDEYNIPGFTPSAFKDFKQYPAVLHGQKGMVTGDEGAKGRAFRKDPKDYDRAVRQTKINKRFGPLGPAVGAATEPVCFA